MEITRKSLFSGEVRTRELDITQEQLDEWSNCALVQNVFPHLSADDREFLITGMTPEEWDALTKEED